MANSNAPVAILSDGQGFLVCVKPPGPDSEIAMPQLLLSETGAPVRCVHRLDAGVGGVMVYAKTDRAAAALSRSLGKGRFEKTYLALCAGTPEPAEGEMRDLLFRDSRRNRSFVVDRMRKGVREAVLRYRVLEWREGVSLVSVTLETGRSHQIRVQFASRRHPLLGDRKYGGKEAGAIALWAWRLGFPHPDTGEMLSFAAPPPQQEPWMDYDQTIQTIQGGIRI